MAPRKVASDRKRTQRHSDAGSAAFGNLNITGRDTHGLKRAAAEMPEIIVPDPAVI